jgi:ribokinase
MAYSLHSAPVDTDPVTVTVTVVGSFVVGLTVRSERMPVSGETLIGRDSDVGPGGKGSNQAVGAAQLGAQVHFAGIIGTDKMGDIATDLYAQAGVHAQCVQRTALLPTGLAFILLDKDGYNRIILDLGANTLMDAAFVEGPCVAASLRHSQVVMTVLEIPPAAAVRAMQLGKRSGAITMMNPAPATKLDPDAFQYIDYLTPNESELRILMGLAPDDATPTIELARQLQARGANTLIVTMGENGALILTKTEQIHVPSIAVDVVDTTGAGDAFSAGLAVALGEGKPLLYAVRFANCCGALACTKLGVVPAMAHRAEAEQLFAKTYG